MPVFVALMTICIGQIRRLVAGDAWVGQRKNSGKFPCLACRGRGTVPSNMVGGYYVACKECACSGHADPKLFQLWAKFFVYANFTEKTLDDTLVPGRLTF